MMLYDHGISGHVFLISGHVFLISGHVGPPVEWSAYDVEGREATVPNYERGRVGVDGGDRGDADG